MAPKPYACIRHKRKSRWLSGNLCTICGYTIRCSLLAAPQKRTTRVDLRSHLTTLPAWAMKEGLCETNPTMATNTYAGIIKRDRVLKPEEIIAIWSALPDNDYGTIIKLLFYTAARRDEIGELTWSELKLADRQIELPAERSKNHRPFLLPLSASGMGLLYKVVEDEKRFVFGQRTNGFSGWSKAKTGLDAKLKLEPWQLRDIRPTVATGMAEWASSRTSLRPA